MRGASGLAAAVLVAFAVLISGSLPRRPPGACAGDSARVGLRLPAPITVDASVTTKRARFLGVLTYQIGCDGRVRRLGKLHSTFQQGAASGATSGVWWAVHDGHLTIGSKRGGVWRSRREFRSMLGLGGVVVGRRTIAFSYGGHFYLAALGGHERLIGREEYALGFTTGGLYTISWLRGLLLRSDTGAILKRLVHWPLNYFAAGGRLYFISHGLVMSARGTRVRSLASLASLELSADAGLQPLSADPRSQVPSGLLEIEDNNRLVVLRQDGSVFASSSSRAWGGGAVSSSAVVGPHASAVAFTAISTQKGGAEGVFVLHAGMDGAVPVYVQRGNLGGCESGASIQWHGDWLLYSDRAGNLVVIQTNHARVVIELAGLFRRLPRTRSGFNASWSSEPPSA